MIQKIKDWLLFVLAIFLSIFGLSLLTRDDKEKLQKVKDNIEKAGDDIEAEHFTDADFAAHYIDDVLSGLGKRK